MIDERFSGEPGQEEESKIPEEPKVEGPRTFEDLLADSKEMLTKARESHRVAYEHAQQMVDSRSQDSALPEDVDSAKKELDALEVEASAVVSDAEDKIGQVTGEKTSFFAGDTSRGPVLEATDADQPAAQSAETASKSQEQLEASLQIPESVKPGSTDYLSYLIDRESLLTEDIAKRERDSEKPERRVIEEAAERNEELRLQQNLLLKLERENKGGTYSSLAEIAPFIAKYAEAIRADIEAAKASGEPEAGGKVESQFYRSTDLLSAAEALISRIREEGVEVDYASQEDSTEQGQREKEPVAPTAKDVLAGLYRAGERSRQDSQNEIHAGKLPSRNYAAERASIRGQAELVNRFKALDHQPTTEEREAFVHELEDIIATELAQPESDGQDREKAASHEQFMKQALKGINFANAARMAETNLAEMRQQWAEKQGDPEFIMLFEEEEKAARDYKLRAEIKEYFLNGTPDVSTAKSEVADQPAVEQPNQPAVMAEPENIKDEEPQNTPAEDYSEDSSEQFAEEPSEEIQDDIDGDMEEEPAEEQVDSGLEQEPASDGQQSADREQNLKATTATAEAPGDNREQELNLERRLFQLRSETAGGVSSERAAEISQEISESLENNHDFYRLMDGAVIASQIGDRKLARSFLESAEKNNVIGGRITELHFAERCCEIAAVYKELGDRNEVKRMTTLAEEKYPQARSWERYQALTRARNWNPFRR